MATLKDHQQAMVDLLASGSGIPASASRLAHAMHDVLSVMLEERVAAKQNRLAAQLIADESNYGISNLLLKVEATTPGLNDKALSKPQKALKTDSPAKWPTPAEQRVKGLENTIRQLKANNAKLKGQLALVREQRDDELRRNMEYEPAGCRKYDTQPCEHLNVDRIGGELICCDCGAKR